jgi:transposase
LIDNYLAHIESLDNQFKRVDEEITSRASQDEDVKLLLSLTGIDVHTALLIKSETSGGFLTIRNLYHGQVWHHHYINQEAQNIMEQ